MFRSDGQRASGATSAGAATARHRPSCAAGRPEAGKASRSFALRLEISASQIERSMSDELKDEGGKIRLYVESGLSEGANVTATESQAHYLLRVMRAKEGDRLSLFNGRDGEWLARI